MPTTSLGLRYPASSAAPNVPQDIQNLATDVNGQFINLRTAPVDLGTYASFANYGGEIKNLCFWREGRTIYVVGTLKLLTSLAGLGKAPVAQLPAGSRPSGTVTAPTNFEGRFEVLSTGDINLVNGRLTAYDANTLFPLNLHLPL